MNITSLTHAAKAGDLPLEKVVGNKSLSEAEKVAEVSRQFESVLLRQILGQARKTIFKSKFHEDSMASGIYQDMATSQLADAISRSGSFGLARSLEAQLVQQNVKSTHSELSRDGREGSEVVPVSVGSPSSRPSRDPSTGTNP